jgi:hypothetical protein
MIFVFWCFRNLARVGAQQLKSYKTRRQMRLSGVSTSNSARGPVSSSLFPGGMMFLARWRLADNARPYALSRLLFTIKLITLALLHVPLLALSLAIDVLRALCGLLFRLLITIRAARLLIHFVLFFHSCFLTPWNVTLSGALNHWMEEWASVMSQIQAAAFEFASCGIFAPAYGDCCSVSLRRWIGDKRLIANCDRANFDCRRVPFSAESS